MCGGASAAGRMKVYFESPIAVRRSKFRYANRARHNFQCCPRQIIAFPGFSGPAFFGVFIITGAESPQDEIWASVGKRSMSVPITENDCPRTGDIQSGNIFDYVDCHRVQNKDRFFPIRLL